MSAKKTAFEGMVGGVEVIASEVGDREELPVDALAVMPAVMGSADDVLGDDDVAYTELKLLQAQSPECNDGTSKPGQWYMMGMQPAPSVVIIPLKVGKSRSLYYPDNAGSLAGKLRCSSSDALTGIGDPGGNCLECPLSQWGERSAETGRGTPPPCTLTYSYVVAIPEFDGDEFSGVMLPGTVHFKRTAAPTAQQLNGLIRQRGMGNFAVVLTAEKRQRAGGSGGGAFFVPQLIFKKLPKAIIAAARELMP